MLDQEARMKAELLSFDIEVETVPEALARLGRKSPRLACAEQKRPNLIG
jgi:hypothetical protein